MTYAQLMEAIVVLVARWNTNMPTSILPPLNYRTRLATAWFNCWNTYAEPPYTWDTFFLGPLATYNTINAALVAAYGIPPTMQLRLEEIVAASGGSYYLAMDDTSAVRMGFFDGAAEFAAATGLPITA